ncbi:MULTISPECIES: ATP-binding cassette domain-containing protein [unclassified Candidatus Frackibacter]|uniref:ATP-binding cassette domain-containing protein n=1 Tax=unclassified Candidatus Frackibacter TaxID=2648818 RepID=UPI0008922A62|nr:MULTISPECIES: ATP-binding cassette domain-containing protein [unclassified Candidatus Frackibacter]SDC26371.1 cobalt/nickel transport system ATP-binding protein [Candidatus Frackibacter sp. WG11]SEM53396.1 cobalt/nickel transport system ATP-binding protein [Candidatus Frackibacter sp. WG12]SFL55130.1 cobalt/nickel transport system ATP-binding protein [Candidatus Frackibacter sp. WG13]
MANIIEVNNLSYKYEDGTTALKGINLSVEESSKVAILGPNGAGKSTLLFHLNALYMVQQGQVKVNSQVVTSDNKEWVRSQVGLVFQDPDDQVFSTTVFEDVAFGLLNFGWKDQDKIKKRVEWALETVGILDLKDKPPHNLSYGQKKRVAIAGILAIEPKIIIFDEPMAYLDPKGKNDFMNILNDLHQREKTILVVTHDVDFAVEWADELIIIKDGKVLANGEIDILSNLKLVKEANLGLPTITKLFKRLDIKDLDKLPQTIEQAVNLLKRYI